MIPSFVDEFSDDGDRDTRQVDYRWAACRARTITLGHLDVLRIGVFSRGSVAVTNIRHAET
jgi:hypothetical protein